MEGRGKPFDYTLHVDEGRVMAVMKIPKYRENETCPKCGTILSVLQWFGVIGQLEVACGTCNWSGWRLPLDAKEK